MACRELPLQFANAGDAPALAAMSRDLIEAGLGWQYRRDRIVRMLADPDTVAVVARDAPRVAAFAIMTCGEDRAHLVLLAVRPSHQRRGIATSLVSWLVDTAVTAGVASIHVELRAGNGAAYALYRSADFEETLRVPGYYRGREAAVRMMRLIRAPNVALPEWRPPTLSQ